MSQQHLPQSCAAQATARATIDSKVGDKRRAPVYDSSSSSLQSVSAPPTIKKRNKRRKSRAVPKPPVKQLSAHDALHFKEIVQQFTGSPTLSPPPTSPPPAAAADLPPPPLITPTPLRPSAASPPDYSLLASSAIAHSLGSTLHMIAAFLQLLHRPSPHSNIGTQSDELVSMFTRKSLAFLQGLLHPAHSESQIGREHTSASSFVDNDFLASLSNQLGSCGGGKNSLFGAIDSNPLFNLACDTGDVGGYPMPSFAMQSHHTPNDHSSNSYCGNVHGGSDHTPLFANETHFEIPYLTNDPPF